MAEEEVEQLEMEDEEEEEEAEPEPEPEASEGESEEEQEGEEGKPSEEEEEETDEDKRSYKLKVFGKERDVTLQEMKRGYQKALAADEKFRQAEKLRQEATQVFEQLVSASDPLEVVEQILSWHLGDPRLAVEQLDQAVRARIERKIEEESLGPEERRIRSAKAEIERKKKELEAERQKQYKTEQEKQRQALLQEFKGVFEKVGLTFNDWTVRTTAQKLLEAQRAGLELSTEEAASEVAREIEDRLREHVESLPEEELAKRYPALRDKIRAANLEKRKRKSATKPVRTSKTTQAARRRPKKKTYSSWAEWRRENL